MSKFNVLITGGFLSLVETVAHWHRVTTLKLTDDHHQVHNVDGLRFESLTVKVLTCYLVFRELLTLARFLLYPAIRNSRMGRPFGSGPDASVRAHSAWMH